MIQTDRMQESFGLFGIYLSRKKVHWENLLLVQEKVLLMTEYRLQKLKIDLTGVLPLSFYIDFLNVCARLRRQNLTQGNPGINQAPLFIIRLQQ